MILSLGICFSGGGIKGAAHIGVLKAFEEAKINFEYISGASSGSIVACLYSMGYKSDEIKEIFKNNFKKIKYVEFKKLIELLCGIVFKGKITIDGLNSGVKIENLMKKYAKEKNIFKINEINKKLLVPSVDMYTGKIYYFSSINDAKNKRTISDKIIYDNNIEIGKAVRASCSYPGVFSPCKYKNNKLIDGGIRENTPWKELKKNGAERVICVTFSEKENCKEENNIFDIIERSIKILNHELSNYELDGVDYMIKIKSLPVNLLETKKFDYLYELGYKYAKNFINKNLDKLNINLSY